MLSRNTAMVCAVAFCLGTSALAQSTDASFVINGIEKQITQSNAIDVGKVAAFHNPAAECAPLCLAPMQATFGVATVGEQDVIAFLRNDVATGQGLLIDTRMPDARALGHIAASVNVPAPLATAENPYLDDIMKALGARSFEGTLNFADAMSLIVFDDGPAAQDAQQFISSLIAVGYPSERIRYYRGGMLVWTALGLNTEEAQS